jgi:hypothetical protein
MSKLNSTTLNVDVTITGSEINHRHGVGILLKRIFQDQSQIVSIRLQNLYGGDHSFGKENYLLSGIGLSRAEIYNRIKEILSETKVDRVLCIPYHSEEIFAALAIHELCDASICTYLMDDQNLLANRISANLMAELLTKSQLRLAISPEMCDLYKARYGLDIYFAPPVISSELVDPLIATPTDLHLQNKIGAMIGNVWSTSWLTLLQQITKTAELKLDWYGNTGADWYIQDRSQLQADGIIEKGFLPTELEVAQVLRQYPYVVVPSGTLDERDDNPSVAWLSLPSRIPFILASSNTPIIVLGNKNTAAARFVTRLGIGVVADYDGASLRQAVEYITQPEIQEQFRTRAASLAPLFENKDTDKWIWQSLAAGKPIDDRFDRILTQPLDYTDALVHSLTRYGNLQQHILELQSQISELRVQIRSMESTKFWKLRQMWFKLKKLLGLVKQID